MRRLLPLVLRSRSLPLLVFALIFPSVASFTLLGPQFGLAAGALSVGVLLVYAARARYDEAIAVAASPDDRYRLLVVAGRPLDQPELATRVAAVAGEGQRVLGAGSAAGPELLVLVPARASRLDRWASDVGPARDQAQRSLALSLASLATAGLDARGCVGDADAVQAIEDELHSFPAREVVLVDGPGIGSREVEEVRRRLDRPVTRL
jgi:hypothetical protein